MLDARFEHENIYLQQYLFEISHFRIKFTPNFLYSKIIFSLMKFLTLSQRVKLYRYSTYGVSRNQSFTRLNCIWKVFTFQCNFMHNPAAKLIFSISKIFLLCSITFCTPFIVIDLRHCVKINRHISSFFSMFINFLATR